MDNSPLVHHLTKAGEEDSGSPTDPATTVTDKMVAIDGPQSPKRSAGCCGLFTIDDDPPPTKKADSGPTDLGLQPPSTALNTATWLVLDRPCFISPDEQRSSLFIVTDPGADIDDEIALAMLKVNSAQRYASNHIIIVDGVPARAGMMACAEERWQQYRTMFTDVFSSHAIPDNVFFHTSKSICPYVKRHGLARGELLWIAPVHNDPQMFELFVEVKFDKATMQGDEDVAPCFNMSKSVSDDRSNYDQMLSMIEDIKFNKIPTPVCRDVCFTPRIIDQVRLLSASFADEVEKGAATMFFGRMPSSHPAAASVLTANLKTAEGYVARALSEMEAFKTTAGYQTFMDANEGVITAYLTELGANSGSGDIDNLRKVLLRIMDIVAYVTNGSLRYDGSLSKVSDESFDAAFMSWKDKKGDAPLTPAYDLLALVVHMKPELMDMVTRKDTDGLTSAVEAYTAEALEAPDTTPTDDVAAMIDGVIDEVVDEGVPPAAATASAVDDAEVMMGGGEEDK